MPTTRSGPDSSGMFDGTQFEFDETRYMRYLRMIRTGEPSVQPEQAVPVEIQPASIINYDDAVMDTTPQPGQPQDPAGEGCADAGYPGHQLCGLCPVHGSTRFECRCPAPSPSLQVQIERRRVVHPDGQRTVILSQAEFYALSTGLNVRIADIGVFDPVLGWIVQPPAKPGEGCTCGCGRSKAGLRRKWPFQVRLCQQVGPWPKGQRFNYAQAASMSTVMVIQPYAGYPYHARVMELPPSSFEVLSG